MLIKLKNMKQLIECVPNISEGSDTKKINEIANIVETIEGVSLLNIDPGKATNRTVITFVGEPENVVEAAFLLIQKAQQLIDMSTIKVSIQEWEQQMYVHWFLYQILQWKK